MKRRIRVLMIVFLLIGSLLENHMSVRAEETEKEEPCSAYELCYSANSWEELQGLLENQEVRPEDTNGKLIKKVSENLESLSTFLSIGLFVPDEEAQELFGAVNNMVELYNQKECLQFSVTLRNPIGAYSEILIQAEKVKVTHLGNVVVCINVPYYENVNAYIQQKNAYYYEEEMLCYACKVAYWNPDGTLERTEEIPRENLESLKDAEKKQIDTNFEGTILVLLCTTEKTLGWASIEDLYQYEDAHGNMEFGNFNPM